MVYTLDDIQRLDKFNDLSQRELIELIEILRNELKFQMYKRDNSQFSVQNNINVLENKLNECVSLNEKYKKSIQHYFKMYDRKLTFKERLFGKIYNIVRVDDIK
jgi:hypothetical protein